MADQKNSQGLAIKLTNVKKIYKLGQIGGGTLQADLQSWWAKIHGREDPNTIIGEQRLVGQTFMALNGIDLEIYRGEALGIIGGNGAGKSTMLKLLSRVTAPTSGKIQIWGRIASMLEVGTGFNGEMTGRENVYMNGAILGMTKGEIDNKIEDIIEFSEVREFIDTPVKRYSSGMYVKLAFSVAAHLDSEIMIMDEVLAVGDMAFQKKCLDKMRDVAQKEGRTVLYVSHNMNTIRQLCDRCIVLDKGKIIFQGDVEEAIEVYLGTAVKLDCHYKYGSSEHTNKGLKNVYIRELNIVDIDIPRVRANEIIPFEIVCDVRKPMRGVEFRFEIQYADGSIAGMTMTDKKMDLLYEGEHIIRMEFDTSHLAPGRYKADIVAFSSDSSGNDYYIDGVIPGIFFEISDEIHYENKKIWLHKYWGHTNYHPIRVKSYERSQPD